MPRGARGAPRRDQCARTVARCRSTTEQAADPQAGGASSRRRASSPARCRACWWWRRTTPAQVRPELRERGRPSSRATENASRCAQPLHPGHEAVQHHGALVPDQPTACSSATSSGRSSPSRTRRRCATPPKVISQVSSPWSRWRRPASRSRRLRITPLKSPGHRPDRHAGASAAQRARADDPRVREAQGRADRGADVRARSPKASSSTRCARRQAWQIGRKASTTACCW